MSPHPEAMAVVPLLPVDPGPIPSPTAAGHNVEDPQAVDLTRTLPNATALIQRLDLSIKTVSAVTKAGTMDISQRNVPMDPAVHPQVLVCVTTPIPPMIDSVLPADLKVMILAMNQTVPPP
jgi:hypothetical protein